MKISKLSIDNVISSLFEDEEKFLTKDDVYGLLKDYKGILSNEIYEYISSLIELDLSALDNTISNETKSMLKGLKFYKDVVIFNIYNKILSIVKEDKYKLGFNYFQNTSYNNLNIKLDNNNVLDFNYKTKKFFSLELKNKYPNIFAFLKLNYYINDDKLKEEMLLNLLNNYCELEDKTNPFPHHKGVIGGPDSVWSFQKSRELCEIKEKYNELENSKPNFELIEKSLIFKEQVLEELKITSIDTEEINEYPGVNVLIKKINM